MLNPIPNVPIKKLLQCNCEYHCQRQQLYNDLYAGGDCFEKNKNAYLAKRAQESEPMHGQKLRKERMACAYYTPISAGIIDWIASSILQAPPMAVIAPKADIPDNTTAENKDAIIESEPVIVNEFWTDLNKEIFEITRNVLFELLVQGRAYFQIESTEEDEEEELTLGWLSAADVDDWGNGWFRVHSVEPKSDNPFEDNTIEVHIWRFVDNERVIIYQAEKEIGKPWASTAQAKLISNEEHDLGYCPIIPLAVPSGMHVMGRLATTALALFNRSAALQYALNASCYSQPVLTTSKHPKTIFANETIALWLNPGDAYTFSTPAGTPFDQLSNDKSRLTDDLFGCIQAMILTAQSKTQNPRQSASAKAMDFSSTRILLNTFAECLKCSMKEALEIIEEYRKVHYNEDVHIHLAGLDCIDTDNLPDKIALVESFIAIPNVPEQAKQWAINSLSLAMCSQAPDYIKTLIMANKPKAEKPKPEPKPESDKSLNLGKEEEGKPESVTATEKGTDEGEPNAGK